MSFRKKIRNAKNNEELENCIDQLVKEKRGLEKEISSYVEALDWAFCKARKNNKGVTPKACKEVLRGLRGDDVTEQITSYARKKDRNLDIPVGSYKRSMMMQHRATQLISDGRRLTHMAKKTQVRKLLEKLDANMPFRDSKFYHREEIPEKLPYDSNIVIKPAYSGSGERSIYIIHREEKIEDRRRNVYLSSWQELKDSLKKDRETGVIKSDYYIVEEIVYEDPENEQTGRDLKFYCFYGKVPLILEIIRFPEFRYCWWTADGCDFDTGKYSDQLFKGEGVDKKDIEQASHISSEIPAPFIRLDFLKSPGGAKFCESHATPGGFVMFNKKTHRWLGDHYLEADRRLAVDLLRGKPFQAYKEAFLEDLPKEYAQGKDKALGLKIKGKVKNVGFRKWAKQRAQELLLRGHVRNLKDGTAWLVVEGAETNVDSMIDLCKEGPEKARVDDIEIKEYAKAVKPGFKIKKRK